VQLQYFHFHCQIIGEFILIKGDYSYKVWRSGGSAKIEKNLYTNQLTTWTYYVPSDDIYYFIWKNTNQVTVIGRSTLTVIMLTYDLLQYTEICVDNPDCSFNLKRGSSQCVIVAGRDNKDGDDTYQVTYFTHPRRDYYWSIFGVLLGLLALIVLLTIAVAFIYFNQKENNDIVATGSLMSPQNTFQN